ncbi:hypothetical protein PM082_011069 [Marasmius tenuissimus]|nr:hypothetical protein PM082_011069 [Marasmius tenuissimus]
MSLWWPVGYGEQALYDSKVELLDREAHVNSYFFKHGPLTFILELIVQGPSEYKLSSAIRTRSRNQIHMAGPLLHS